MSSAALGAEAQRREAVSVYKEEVPSDGLASLLRVRAMDGGKRR